MLKIINLNKYYNKSKQNEIHVLKNISVEFPDTGLVAFLGQSGSGKSTLLNCICGIDSYESGEIYLDDAKLPSKPSRKYDIIRNKDFGYIFQSNNLFMDKTVFENVMISLKLLGINDTAFIKKSVLDALDLVGMKNYSQRLASKLSGGEKQRVAIARALVKNPKIILADEATGNLDEKNTHEVMQIFKKISKKKLVIFVTHEMDIANFYADNIVNLKDGTIKDIIKNTNSNAIFLNKSNNVYIGDHNKIVDSNVVSFYSNNEPSSKTIVVEDNDNIYIKTYSNKNVHYINKYSEYEIHEGKRPLIKIADLSDKEFDLSTVDNMKKPKSSGISFWFYFKQSIISVIKTPFLKKLMLIGFIVSGFMIALSICGSSSISDENFTISATNNKNLLVVNYMKKDDNFENIYNEFEGYKDEGLIYEYVSFSKTSFALSVETFFQTDINEFSYEASFASLGSINPNLVSGRLPENDFEILVDKALANQIYESDQGKLYSLTNNTSMLRQYISVNGTKFNIVGITDNGNPSFYLSDFYAKRSRLQIVFLQYDIKDLEHVNTDVTELGTFDILIKTGSILKKNTSFEEREYVVGDKIKFPFSNKEYTVRGFTDDAQYVFSNEGLDYIELYYNYKFSRTGILYSNNISPLIEKLEDNNYITTHLYQIELDAYKEKIKPVRNILNIFTIIALVESLVYLTFLMRSNLISRIKEIGINKALGVSNFQMYKMELAKLLGITILTSYIGLILGLVLTSELNKVIGINFLYVTFFTVLEGFVAVTLINILVGLIPIFFLLRRTPAQILRKYDM